MQAGVTIPSFPDPRGFGHPIREFLFSFRYSNPLIPATLFRTRMGIASPASQAG
jgi:hypothetical protein